MPEIEVVCDKCGEPLDALWDYPSSGLAPTLRICPCLCCRCEEDSPQLGEAELRRLSEGW